MFLEEPRFPDSIAWGASGGPLFSTTVTPTPGGYEQRIAQQVDSLAVYEVGLVNKDAALTEELIAFFNIVKGRAHGFRFPDFQPGESTGTNEPIALGNGIWRTAQLTKRYQYGDWIYDRPIYKPVVGTVVVCLNGIILDEDEVQVDHTLGEITLYTPPAEGVLVTATYQFDVPARFDTDTLQIARVDVDTYRWDACPIIELPRWPLFAAARLERWQCERMTPTWTQVITENWGG